MNPQDPLAALQPLLEPGLIGWWPLAPGWWLLLLLLVATGAGLGWLAWRRHRSRAYRRQALAQLDQLHQEFQQHQDAKSYLAAGNALLKSVALRAYPPERVASRTGREWEQFLNASMGKKRAEFPADFASASYRKNCPQLDMEQFYQCSANWIRNHEVSS